jgi:hypothetical protein
MPLRFASGTFGGTRDPVKRDELSSRGDLGYWQVKQSVCRMGDSREQVEQLSPAAELEAFYGKLHSTSK